MSCHRGLYSVSNLYVRGVEKLRGVTFFNTVIHKKRKKSKSVFSMALTSFQWHYTVYQVAPLLLTRKQEVFLSRIYFIFFQILMKRSETGTIVLEKSFVLRTWWYSNSKRNNKTLNLTKMGIRSYLLIKRIFIYSPKTLLAKVICAYPQVLRVSLTPVESCFQWCNDKLTGFLKKQNTKPWFAAFADFHCVNTHQGWFQATKEKPQDTTGYFSLSVSLLAKSLYSNLSWH